MLVDCDGPLADFDAAFFARCEANGWPLDCTLENQRHRFATDHIPNRTHRALARKMVDTAGWFADLPVVGGAVEGLAALDEVADTWVCSKPLEANPSSRDDKARWLTMHFGSYWAERLILVSDKSMVRGDVLLDDAPHPQWYGTATWTPVIFATPWNGAGSKWEGLPRWTWGDDVNQLLECALDADRV